jgi:hypothetical protein
MCRPQTTPPYPSAFGRNVQCEPVRTWTPERNAIVHTHVRFKRAGVGPNGILECKFLAKNAHRTSSTFVSFAHCASPAAKAKNPPGTHDNPPLLSSLLYSRMAALMPATVSVHEGSPPEPVEEGELSTLAAPYPSTFNVLQDIRAAGLTPTPPLHACTCCVVGDTT